MAKFFELIKKEWMKHFSILFSIIFTVAGFCILWSYVSDIIERNKIRQYDKRKPKIYAQKVPFFAHLHPFPDGNINIDELFAQIFAEDYPNDDVVGPIVALSDHDNVVFDDLVFEEYDKISTFVDVEKINDYTVRVCDKGDLDNDGNCDEFFYLLKSAEISAKLPDGRQAHVVGIGITELPKKYSDIRDVVMQLKDQGAIVIVPHPACHAIKGMGKKTLTELVEEGYVDFCEVNGSFPKTPLNLLGFDYNKKARQWAEELKVPVVANSDAHVWYTIKINGKKERRYGCIDTYVNLLDKSGFKVDDLRSYIRDTIIAGRYETIEYTPHSIELIKWLFPLFVAILRGNSASLGDKYPPPNLRQMYEEMYK